MFSATTKIFNALQAEVTALKNKIIQAVSNTIASKKQVAALQREQTKTFTELKAFGILVIYPAEP